MAKEKAFNFFKKEQNKYLSFLSDLYIYKCFNAILKLEKFSVKDLKT